LRSCLCHRALRPVTDPQGEVVANATVRMLRRADASIRDANRRLGMVQRELLLVML